MQFTPVEVEDYDRIVSARSSVLSTLLSRFSALQNLQLFDFIVAWDYDHASDAKPSLINLNRLFVGCPRYRYWGNSVMVDELLAILAIFGNIGDLHLSHILVDRKHEPLATPSVDLHASTVRFDYVEVPSHLLDALMGSGIFFAIRISSEGTLHQYWI